MKHFVFALLFSSAACGGKPAPEPEQEKKDDGPTLVAMTPEAVKAAGVTVEPITEGDVVTTEELPGTIEAQNGALVVVNTRAAGIVESTAVDIGDRVKANQALASVRSLDLAEAQSAFRKASVADKYAGAALERSEGLKQDGVISDRRLEADRQAAREAKLAVEEAEKRIRILGGAVNDVSGTFSIVSPIDGAVAARKVNRGESVAANTPLFTIVDASRIVVQLRALGGTPAVVGTEIEFTVDAIKGRTFKAVIQSASDLLDPETRRFLIRCSVDNKDLLLKPGMFVTGRLPSSTIKALTVSESAVQTIEGKSIVFIEKAAGKYERREVALGPKANKRVAVEKGVKAGERVVAEGSFMVRTQMQKSELEE